MIDISTQPAKKIWNQMKEFLQLAWIRLRIACQDFWDFISVAARYYRNWTFCKLDGQLYGLYLFNNAFSISKKYRQAQQAEEIYVYGETPLITWQKIAETCRINAKDTLIELGCGRGRLCFWSKCFIGCQVIGIEEIGLFVKRARYLVEKEHLSGIQFFEENFLEADLGKGTVLYLYGSCLEDEAITQLAKKCASLAVGTKIITVSYSLAEYLDGSFEVLRCFPASFPWGTADVYLQVVKQQANKT